MRDPLETARMEAMWGVQAAGQERLVQSLRAWLEAQGEVVVRLWADVQGGQPWEALEACLVGRVVVAEEAAACHPHEGAFGGVLVAALEAECCPLQEVASAAWLPLQLALLVVPLVVLQVGLEPRVSGLACHPCQEPQF